MEIVANKIVRMPCKSKSIHFVVMYIVLRENSLPLMNYEGFSYPTHFLLKGGSDIRNNFLE